MEALQSPLENAVKVAYMILKDRKRAGRESWFFLHASFGFRDLLTLFWYPICHSVTPLDQKPDGARKAQNFLALASAVVSDELVRSQSILAELTKSHSPSTLITHPQDPNPYSNRSTVI